MHSISTIIVCAPLYQLYNQFTLMHINSMIYIYIYINIYILFIYDTTQFVYQHTLSIRAVAPGSPKTCRARRGRGCRGPQEICALVGPGDWVTCHLCNFQKGRKNRTKIVVNNDGKLLFLFFLFIGIDCMAVLSILRYSNWML